MHTIGGNTSQHSKLPPTGIDMRSDIKTGEFGAAPCTGRPVSQRRPALFPCQHPASIPATLAKLPVLVRKQQIMNAGSGFRTLRRLIQELHHD
jgi:hypothetical protein